MASKPIRNGRADLKQTGFSFAEGMYNPSFAGYFVLQWIKCMVFTVTPVVNGMLLVYLEFKILS